MSGEVKAARVMRQQDEASRHGAISIWTVFYKPWARPDGFIARRMEVGVHGRLATQDTLTGTLQDIRHAFWKAGLRKLSRADDDERDIVESWL